MGQGLGVGSRLGFLPLEFGKVRTEMQSKKCAYLSKQFLTCVSVAPKTLDITRVDPSS